METTEQKKITSDIDPKEQPSPVVVKRPRGRPRKTAPVMPVEKPVTLSEQKRPRGRPPKADSITNGEVLPLTLGMVLQQARLARHMKLSSIAKKLRIKEVYLDALEKGHYHDFPALVYGVGFLRTYAVFLGLNAEELVTRFHRETTDIPDEPLNMPHNADPKLMPSAKTIIKSLIALVLLYLVWNVYKAMIETPAPEPDMPIVSQTVTEQGGEIVSAPMMADELPNIDGSAQKGEEKAKPLPPLLPKRTPVVYGLKKAARVSLVATDKVWIEVRDVEADQVLLEKTLDVGDKFNPDEDSEGLVLKTTNAGGLDVYIDGKKKKALGNKGQTKAGITLDAAGLTGK